MIVGDVLLLQDAAAPPVAISEDLAGGVDRLLKGPLSGDVLAPGCVRALLRAGLAHRAGRRLRASDALMGRRRDNGRAIGPHDGIELPMLLAGTKPVALLQRPAPCDEADALVDAGRLVRRSHRGTSRLGPGPLRLTVYARPERAGEAEDLLECLACLHDRGRDFSAAEHADIGRRLGYRPRHVEAFLDRLGRLVP